MSITPQLALWIVLGGLALVSAGLFVTMLARGMDTGRTKFSAADAEGLAAVLPGGPIGNLLRKRMLASTANDASDAHAARKRKSGVIAAAVGAATALAVGAGIAKDIFEKDEINVSSLAPVEITAGQLHGTLLSPRKKAPVVLIVPGSGPTDRDGNNPLGVGAKSYKLLAEALASDGIASVRVDKRGMFGSKEAGDGNAVTVEKYAEDYRSWIDAIRAQTGRRCVWLLGHSEGALMVSAAAEGRKDVCGLILVSGMGRKLGDVLREQLTSNPANAPLLDQALPAVAELEAGRHVDTTGMHPALLPLFAPQVQDFLISVMTTDPVEAVRRAHVKTLIVQGTTDIQVTEQDARLLDKAPRTRLVMIDGMNHILKEAPIDRAANIATYADPNLPLHPKLEGKIEDFIKDDD